MGKRKERKLHQTINNIEYKHCSRCDSWKSLDDYNLSNSSWDKLQPYCKDCLKLLENMKW